LRQDRLTHCAVTPLGDYGGEGGILTPAYSLSYHVFTNLRETRMGIGDFYDLFYYNAFHCFA